ncbi:hypothetical protein ACP4OV_030287 [Aristida adscensionis]
MRPAARYGSTTGRQQGRDGGARSSGGRRSDARLAATFLSDAGVVPLHALRALAPLCYAPPPPPPCPLSHSPSLCTRCRPRPAHPAADVLCCSDARPVSLHRHDTTSLLPGCLPSSGPRKHCPGAVKPKLPILSPTRLF